MTATSMPPPEPLCVDIFWDPEVLAGSALAVVDVLRSINLLAAMRWPRVPAPATWRWLTATGVRRPSALPRGEPFRGTAAIVVVPGWHAKSGPHLDRIVQRCANAMPRLRQAHAANNLVAGLANGVALLGEAGLLSGRAVAVPWPFVASVLRHGEDLQLLSERAWNVDNRVWTCASPVQATEVILDMLGQTPLAELAAATAHVYLYSRERQQVTAQIVQGTHQRILPAGSLERARRWLQEHMTEPYSLAATAQAAATSARTLSRQFAIAHNQSPLDYLHRLRVARARVLLETTYVSVEQVAQMCGYHDVGTFRRIFQRQTQTLPAAYRERYRLRTSRKRWVGDGEIGDA